MFNRCSLDGLSSAISDGYSSFKSTLADENTLIGFGCEKIQQTSEKIRSLVTVDNLAQASIAASIAFGGAVALSGGNPIHTLEGIVIASAGTAMSTTAWGIASLFRGERNAGIKKLMIAGVLYALAAKTAAVGPNAIYQQSQTFNMMKDELSELRTEHQNTKNELFKVNQELLTLNNDLLKTTGQLNKFKNLNIDKDEYLKLFIDNANCKRDLAQSKAVEKALQSRGFFDRLSNKAPEVIVDYDDEESPFAKRHITFGTTYVKDPSRESQAAIINPNHKEYAQAWKIKHKVVEDNLLIGQCTDKSSGWSKSVDCVAYWNKVAVLRNWLNEPKKGKKEEWYILVDDDMPVTNMKVDPSEAIDLLRRGKDTSVIIVRDVSLWKKGDEELSVNTGLIMVRKDEQSRKLIEKLWEKRNDSTGSNSDVCKTLGTCKNQNVLHEQEGFARVIEDDRSIINKVLTIVKPRDLYNGKELALNVFNRWGCFYRDQEHWGKTPFSYEDMDNKYKDDKFPNGKPGQWRVGDWMGQTAGVPANGWYCDDKEAGLPPGPIRNDRLKIMISKAVR